MCRRSRKEIRNSKSQQRWHYLQGGPALMMSRSWKKTGGCCYTRQLLWRRWWQSRTADNPHKVKCLHFAPQATKAFGCVNDFYKKNPSNSHAWGRKGLPTKETQQKKDIESILRYNKYATLTPSLATHLLFAPAILIAQELKHPFLWLKDLLVINFCLRKNHDWPLELPMFIYIDINPKLCAKSVVFKIE